MNEITFISLENDDSNMKDCKFFYHRLDIKEKENSDLISLLDKIKEETDSNKTPEYVETAISKLHARILKTEVEGNKRYYFGKLIHSHKPVEFKEESLGTLFDLEMDEDSTICHKTKGIIYFLLYIDTERDKKILMMEDIPFAINIGGLINYLSKRLSISQDKITTKQKLGHDLVNLLHSIGESEMVLAKIRTKKNISEDDMNKTGFVDDILKRTKEKQLDCELVLRWSSSKREKLNDFICKLFNLDAISKIEDVDFGSFLRTLYFEIDNTAHPRINMKDDVIKFLLPKEKEYYVDNENTLFDLVMDDLSEKMEANKLDE